MDNKNTDTNSDIVAGFMTDVDIEKAIEQNQMRIAPYNKAELTPIGYNFSFSKFIVSLRTKQFQKIHIDKNGKLFFVIKPFETVLILTNEAIWVSKEIGGTFHSKVGFVVKGLGHVSTTLDPGWQGQLLIPMNNPTKNNVEVEIGEKTEQNGNATYKYKSFITLVLYKAITPAEREGDNKDARYDILNSLISNKNKKRYRNIKKAVEEMQLEIKNNKVNYKKVPKDQLEDKLVNCFDKNYNNISRRIEMLYNDEINSATDYLSRRKRIVFSFILLFMLFSIVAIIWVGIYNTLYQWVSATFLSVLIPIYIALFPLLKNELL